MKDDQKQVELEKHKGLIDASLNYLLLHDTGNRIYDGVDPEKRFYESQLAQAERYFNTNNLNKLEHQLGELIRLLQHKPKPDFDFKNYIKEHTGYELDILAEHRKSFEEVLLKGRIDTQKEGNDLCIMLAHLGIDEKEMHETYEPMLIDFHQRHMAAIEASPELKKKYDEHHETVEENGELIEIFYSGGKPSHHHRRVALAPNGKCSLSITEIARDDHSSTSIQLDIENFGCSLYSVDGVHPEIDAFWKDNQTIVIKTNGYQSDKMHKKIEIFGHVFTIDYLES